VDICTRLGQNVRQLREAKGWSQEDYADRAGIHRTYVSDIEVERLAQPLGVTTGSLLD
jgi:ribosome-binding protein aMBF1 (putative translation factor)